MKKLIYINLLLLAVLCACSKDYLETKPTNSTGSSTVFATTDNAALAVNGLAKLMTRQYLESQGFNGEGTIKMYYGNYPGNDFYVNLPGWSNIINATFYDNTNSIYCYYPWYYYYRIIGNANSIIVNINEAEGPESEKQFIKAQALSYRAYSYMMLAQLYGFRWSDSNNGNSDGVVLRLDESTGDLPVSTLGETYGQIYTDLNEAITLYEASGKHRESSENYHPDIEVAYAIYARAALNRQDYATAEDYARKARENHALMSASEYQAGFCNPNSEWIWSCHGSLEETLYYYSYFAYIGYNSNASAVRNTPKCISKELYEKIPSTDIRKKLFLDPVDLSYNLSTGAAGAALKAKAFELYPDIYETSTIFAYMQFKIKNNENPGVGYLNNFRSSEMYLIEAEAKYFQGKSAVEIQEVMNDLVRNSGRDGAYNCTKTGEELLADIKLYRTIELWGEGFDWFDMKRWGDAIDRKDAGRGGNFSSSLAVRIEPNLNSKWTWKIPLKETDFNNAL